MTAPDVPATFELARPVLAARPVGADPLALRSMMLAHHGGTTADLDATTAVAGDVMIGAYLDLPTADVPVSWNQLERWGVTPADALQAARENLGRMDVPTTRVGQVTYVDHPTLAAAVLQDPRIAAQLLPGAVPWVLAPSQQHVILADARDPAQVARAIDLARSAVESDTRQASITPLTPAGAGWQVAAWPAGTEEQATRLRHHWNNRLYASARELVKAANERMGIDAVVAAYQVGAKPGGETMAMTPFVDSPGLRTFLPPADQVLLVTADGATTPVPYARLAAIPGLLVPVAGLAPSYVEATRFPSELL